LSRGGELPPRDEVRADLEGEELRLTMLHEMCHIGSGAGWVHGPLFRRKVRRLVRLGVPGLVEDIERYDGTADELDALLSSRVRAGLARLQ